MPDIRLTLSYREAQRISILATQRSAKAAMPGFVSIYRVTQRGNVGNYMELTPGEAREVARLLLCEADRAEVLEEI